MPGHIKHKDGDTFEQIYLSYLDKPIPATAFKDDFAPDAKYLYQREGRQDSRAHDPRVSGEARRQAGAVAGGDDARPGGGERGVVPPARLRLLHRGVAPAEVKAGESFGAAYVVGWFDDVEEMEKAYDAYKGKSKIVLGKDRVQAGVSSIPMNLP